ncbi:DNA cytosine methyltransferase [Pseudomonas lini]|uniref:DNA (cytosine-5-)-methyltransferase n=1 Tax=Pseudomonas lini TaxID=163011 RepID=A0A1H2BXN5_9PSED|nr:DNA cytosine methyltransferase [Pseudomonas lini]KAB0506062.1 DNA cytosine methyltransferase [Pseudomonas lini]SDT63065.1 DNA (cytosine-5)-methyltransferase 1 [Pseudomonas lini]
MNLPLGRDKAIECNTELSKPIQIVDLFAGPGGLGEGFASSGNGTRFEIVVSAEMDPVARETLKLRAFYRLLKLKKPDRLCDYYDFCNGHSQTPFSDTSKALWLEAEEEARCITLGSEKGDEELDKILDDRLKDRPWVLIGGPPCQAYSIVGRSRNQGKADYSAENDHRHFLYKEYLRIIKERKPAVFVMENVKGILSSKIAGESIFAQILQDLTDPNKALGDPAPGTKYRICSLVTGQSFGPGDDVNKVDPRGFIIKAEEHGIPQARHRVILLGIALDDEGNIPEYGSVPEITGRVSTKQVLGELPELRSRLTKQRDDGEAWYREVANQLDELRSEVDGRVEPKLDSAMKIARDALLSTSLDVGALRVARRKGDGKTGDKNLDRWYRDDNLEHWLNHDARGHMSSDLRRYMFASVYARAYKTSPKGHQQFSLSGLAPAHKNWESGKFSDRFRVQLEELPATTVTSHISKDGHYFIHYDPKQCRSLTVREAARLQTFPDNYFFQGNRTQQFHQVGNAVPPLLANKIASVVYAVVCKKTRETEQDCLPEVSSVAWTANA